MDEKPQSVRSGDGGGGPRVATNIEDSPPGKPHMIPVWFFVGVILLIYGVIILGEGIYEIDSPPPTVLSNLHPALWWGVLLIILGGVQLFVHMPKKS
jgi:hypothetical protein